MNKDKYIAILGGGESGVGAAVLANKKGIEVFLSDKGKIKEKYKKVLSQIEVRWEEEKHSEEVILRASEVIKSPGIPDNAPLIVKLKEKGTPVISEIEFAGRYTQGKKICITGSNGKTTTTLLTSHILKQAGLDVATAGNVGQSFAGQLAEADHDYWVLELSSFQLDGMYDFKAEIAILLNITPDHMDRYDYELQNYVDSKFRIVQNQKESDAFIFWNEDPIIAKELTKRNVQATLYSFSEEQEAENENWQGARTNENKLVIQTNNNYFNMSIHELALQGKHNLLNSMASGVASRILDLRKDLVRDSLINFENVEHRLEFVAKVAGISFINDSKATNINSTWYALESMEKEVIWIAGGVDKGNDYSELYELVDEKVKAIICLGTDNSKLHEAFEGRVETMIDTESAAEAVQLAYDLGFKNDAVLLSPACASFDLFDSYEDRGHQFKRAVKSL